MNNFGLDCIYTRISTQLSVLRALRSRFFCSLSPTPPLRNSCTSFRVCSSSSSLTMGSRAARYCSHVCFKGGTGSLGKPSWCTRDLSGICVTGLTRRHGFTMPGRSYRTQVLISINSSLLLEITYATYYNRKYNTKKLLFGQIVQLMTCPKCRLTVLI